MHSRSRSYGVIDLDLRQCVWTNHHLATSLVRCNNFASINLSPHGSFRAKFISWPQSILTERQPDTAAPLVSTELKMTYKWELVTILPCFAADSAAAPLLRRSTNSSSALAALCMKQMSEATCLNLSCAVSLKVSRLCKQIQGSNRSCDFQIRRVHKFLVRCRQAKGFVIQAMFILPRDGCCLLLFPMS